MEALVLLVILLVLIGPVLAIAALISASGLRRRVEGLEARLAATPDAATAHGTANSSASSVGTPDGVPPSAATDGAMSTAAVAGEGRIDAAASSPPPPSVPSPTAHAQPVLAKVAAPPAASSSATQPFPRRPIAPATPNFVDRFIAGVKHWFTSGNVPAKIGMLVLLVGVAALLRYASNEGWLTLPIELRLAVVAAAAIAGLVFAWRQRDSHRAFALALQGGAIGVLLLVVFAAFKLYHLVGVGPAFAISVILIAGLAVLAVLQDSRTLAILGALAGFMAPLWLGNGGGNHVALFTWYAVVNAGLLGIAWQKPWRVLNLVGFAFTWSIGTLWGVLEYRPEQFNSTEPFLLLFFAFYLLLPILYARRVATPQSRRIDGCLLFGTPLVAFALQAGLLEGARMALAFCALGLAALYAALAWWLRGHDRVRLLAQGYAILGVGFATLAVPLALSARATAAVFALEGAGLVWLGWQQQRRLPRWAGIALQILAAGAFLIGTQSGGTNATVHAVANATFMGALLIALAGFSVAWLYRRAGETRGASIAYLWALAWWLGDGWHEIVTFVPAPHPPHAALLFLALTGWLAADWTRRAPARLLDFTALGALLAAFPLAFLQQGAMGHPLGSMGWVIWPLVAALGARSLVCLRAASPRVANATHLAWWLTWPVVLSLEAWFVGRHFGLADGWVGLLLALPWLVLAAVSLRRWPWLRWPRGAAFDAFLPLLRVLIFAALIVWWLRALFDAGDSAPLPWVAVFNPLDLAQLALLVLTLAWLWMLNPDPRQRRDAGLLLAVAAFALVTVITLRAVHHWGGVAWDGGLVHTQLAQTSLSVVWSVLGVIGWISGSRRGLWQLWLAGAILMGVVLAKLLLIDRGNLGDLLGIGAFIAYGLLCTLVGWMAPAPPRRPAIDPDAGASA